MGLDMYLSRRTYVKNWDHMQPSEKTLITITDGDGKPRTDIKPGRISYTTEQVAYWRKANQIHQWFVDNVQGGVDECQEADVPREKLQELLDLCKQIKADPTQAATLLPTRAGFFFGGTEYDEYYMEDIGLTITQLEEILSLPADQDGASYSYQSSW